MRPRAAAARAPRRADSRRARARAGRPGAARCLGGDAFVRAPVAQWEPPETARLEQIQQWKKLKAQSDAAIRGFARGGKELRAFVSDQVDRLRLARHNLFCGLAPPGRGEA